MLFFFKVHIPIFFWVKHWKLHYNFLLRFLRAVLGPYRIVSYRIFYPSLLPYIRYSFSVLFDPTIFPSFATRLSSSWLFHVSLLLPNTTVIFVFFFWQFICFSICLYSRILLGCFLFAPNIFRSNVANLFSSVKIIILKKSAYNPLMMIAHDWRFMDS